MEQGFIWRGNLEARKCGQSGTNRKPAPTPSLSPILSSNVNLYSENTQQHSTYVHSCIMLCSCSTTSLGQLRAKHSQLLTHSNHFRDNIWCKLRVTWKTTFLDMSALGSGRRIISSSLRPAVCTSHAFDLKHNPMMRHPE